MSSKKQKIILNFNEVLLVNSTFIYLALGIVPLPNSRSSRLSTLLSSKSFIVLHFTFGFVNHFELIFVKDIKSVSRKVVFFFFFWHVDGQIFHLFLKRFFFSIVLLFLLCQRPVDCIYFFILWSIYKLSILFQ